ncbi:MAG: phage Gp37/Gp68 family protein [Bacteroidales bacterium]|nr:phage Gp37/Gp68 family protein [Bacteroidales bacterium]
MSENWNIYADWNPWHGCTKISPGCKYCYVYRQDEMYGSDIASSLCRKTANFNLPIKRKRDKSWKIESGRIVFTCFTSDFLLKDADDWRPECWQMMKQRKDLYFFFFTKRIDRFLDCIPDDWGDGYENVIVGCTIENQDRADFRLPIFKSLSIKHKTIIVAPMIDEIDLSAYLDNSIEEVSVGGESGINARPCNYDWILKIREQCISHDIPFRFHQTGAFFIKDGHTYRIHRKYQLSQAHKANIDYKIGEYLVPKKVKFEWTNDVYHDLQ